MKNKYSGLVGPTFDWPSEEFYMTEDHTLDWNGLDLRIINKVVYLISAAIIASAIKFFWM